MSAELTQERPERLPHEYYSPERKAEVLTLYDANDGNLKRTANETGIDHSTIRYWLDNRDRYRELQPQNFDLASKFESNAHLLVNSIANHDLSTASLSQKATAAGIMVDKMQLLRNQPTSITQHVNSESLTVVLQQVLNEITTSTEQD